MEKTEMKTGDIVLTLDEAIKVKDFLEKVAYKTTWKEVKGLLKQWKMPSKWLLIFAEG